MFKTYEDFKIARRKLLEDIEKLKEPLHSIGLQQRDQLLDTISQRLQQDTFKIMVLGEFKRGKSTLINALLGKDILPAKVPPCTAVITEVKYGQNPKAILHFNQNQPPKEITVEEIANYITIQENANPYSLSFKLTMDSNGKEKLERQPYKKMELYYPLALCQNNVEIIDSPGLNEAEIRRQITEDYLGKLDAAVLVLSCEQFFSTSEQKFLQEYANPERPIFSTENLFIVANYADILDDAEEGREAAYDALKKRADKYLRAIFQNQFSKRVFFVSCKQALEGKKKKNDSLLNNSGFPALEIALEDFLARERGWIKMAQSVHGVRSIIREGIQYFPDYINILKQEVGQLEAKREEIQPGLVNLKERKQNVSDILTKECDDLLSKIAASYQKFNEKLAEETQKFLVNYEPECSLWNVKKYITEIQNALKEKVDSLINNWKENELKQVIEKNMEQTTSQLEKHAQEFLDQISQIRTNITGQVSVTMEEVNDEEPSALGKVLGGIVGLLAAGTGGAMEGSRKGALAIIKDMWPNFIDVAVAVILCWSNPILLLGILGYGIFLKSFYHKDFTTNIKGEIKSKIWEAFAKGTQAALGNMLDDISNSITAKFETFRKYVLQGFQARIDDISQQLNTAIQQARAKKGKIKEEETRLKQQQETLTQIDEDLEKVMKMA